MPQREFLQHNTIVKYTLDSMKRDAIDTWSQLVLQTAEEWPHDKPYRSLQDFTEINLLTPGLKDYAKKVNKYFAEQDFSQVCIAVLLQKTPLTQIGKRFVERDLADAKIRRRVFFDEQEAIEWLTGCGADL